MAITRQNLFLCKQLALYVERKKRPHRATDAIRFTLAQLSRLFEFPFPEQPTSFPMPADQRIGFHHDKSIALR